MLVHRRRQRRSSRSGGRARAGPSATSRMVAPSPPSSAGTAIASRPASRRARRPRRPEGALDVVAGGVLGEDRRRSRRPRWCEISRPVGRGVFQWCCHARDGHSARGSATSPGSGPSRYRFVDCPAPARCATMWACPTTARFCPVALASEVLADRWTPLIVRELVLGNTRFNDIARGLPGISRSLLVAAPQAPRAQGRDRDLAVAQRAGAASTTSPPPARTSSRCIDGARPLGGRVAVRRARPDTRSTRSR